MDEFIGKYQIVSNLDTIVWWSTAITYIETIEMSREGKFWIIKMSDQENTILKQFRFELGKRLYRTSILHSFEASFLFTFEESRLIAVEKPTPRSFSFGPQDPRWVWELEGADLTQTIAVDGYEPVILSLKRI